jgi:acetoin utilization deacetylase AcuC-like enzyme
MLDFHHASSLEHDPRVLAPEHPDSPGRIEAIEAVMTEAGWPGCELRSAPAATESELTLVHSAESFARMAWQLR